MTRKARSTAIALSILAAILLIPTGASAASITYHVVNYPDLQSGYTVTGTITTNGATGNLLPVSDITSWDITITGPAGTFELTPINSYTPGSPAIDVTPTTITVATPGAVIEFDNLNQSPYIFWSSTGVYGGDGPGGMTLWITTLFNPATDALAVIPEPSSAVLAVIGAGTVVACGLVRHRRAKRRKSDAGHTQPKE